MTHSSAPLSEEGRRRLVESCRTHPITHVANEMGSFRTRHQFIRSYTHDTTARSSDTTGFSPRDSSTPATGSAKPNDQRPSSYGTSAITTVDPTLQIT